MSAAAIRLAGISKRFGDVVAVADAPLSVDHGEIVAVLGPSGCGKTTLLRLIAGFERPDLGTVYLDGAPVAGEDVWVAPHRRRVGMVFQDYALFSHLTVAENIGFGLGRQQRPDRIRELLDIVGLPGLGERYPHELSGGQQQRVAVARALAPRPRIVVMDEPWSNIDPGLRVSMRDELAVTLRAAGVTVVLVTHDREEAFSLADRIALMRDGRVIQVGTAEELYFSPASRWAAEFVGAANILRGVVEGDVVRTPVGPVPVPGNEHAGEVEVIIRPEQLVLHEDACGDGLVVGREFRGHDVFYRVLLDRHELISQRPSTESVAVGARVAIRLSEMQTTLVPGSLLSI
jgi:iron(III) transport system ATP-binding protein